MSNSATAATDTTNTTAAAAFSGEAPVMDPLSVEQALAGGAGLAQDSAATELDVDVPQADAAPLAVDLQDLGQKVGL
jgi:hypothetical protein